jgi:hypothetical protein
MVLMPAASHCARSPRSGAIRVAATLIAACAILLQVLLGAPLLIRMSAGGTWLAGVPTCHRDASDQPAGPEGHDHAHCVLCQGNLLPPPASAIPVPRPGAEAALPASCIAMAAPPPGRRRHEGYASRAPPSGPA